MEGYLKVKEKGPRSLPMLKRSTHAGNVIPDVVVDLMDLVCANVLLTYLCLMIDTPLERDHIERCRLMLRRLFLSIKSAD